VVWAVVAALVIVLTGLILVVRDAEKRGR